MTSVGMVGTGYWAQTIHGPNIAALEGLAARGVWGRNAAERDHLARELGLHAFATFDELVASVDIVDFAVPPATQVDLAVTAAEAGRHLLLEKPMAVSVPQAQRLHAAVARAGVAAVVFLTRLFEPVRAAWLAEQARLGHVHGRVRWISAALAEGSPYARSAWRGELGSLWDVGPHILSQLEAVLGPVTGVTVDAHDPRGLSRLELRHRGEAVSEVEMTLHAQPSEKEETFEFEGPAGRAIVPDQPLDFATSHANALAALIGQVEHPAVSAEGPTTTRAGLQMTRVLATIEGLFREGPQGRYVPVAAAP